jgi:hypothetical protein
VKLWLAGRSADDEEWEVLGIYTTEERAVARCVRGCDFVWPTEADVDFPEETEEMPEAYFPLGGTS